MVRTLRSLVILLLALCALVGQAAAQRTVHVRGYTRRDGTYVAPYDRRAPGTATPATVPPPPTVKADTPPTKPARLRPGGVLHADSAAVAARDSARADSAAHRPAGRGYINSRGDLVRSPTRTPNNQPPAGASAHCRDGTYSFSRSRSGTCSHHGGVGNWL